MRPRIAAFLLYPIVMFGWICAFVGGLKLADWADKTDEYDYSGDRNEDAYWLLVGTVSGVVVMIFCTLAALVTTIYFIYVVADDRWDSS